MADKKFIGTFHSEHEVLDKIETLKEQGFREDDIYVVTNDTDSLSMVQGRTDVELRSSEGNWLDKFKAFLTGDEPVMAAFTNMGFSEDESAHFYNAVKQDGILLFVDRDYIQGAPDTVTHNKKVGLGNEHVSVDYSPGLAETHHTNNLQEENAPIYKEKMIAEEQPIRGNTTTVTGFNDKVNVHSPTIEEQVGRKNNPLLDEIEHDANSHVEKPDEVNDIETEIDKERLENDAVIDRNRLL